MHRDLSALRAFALPRAATSLLRAALLCAPALAATAQSPQPRIRAAIDNERRSVLPGSMSPRAKFAQDTGELAAESRVAGMTLSFAPSAAQKAELDTLIAAQQNPDSPSYHQWLTPEQFGARFGMSDADLGKVEAWLRSGGFTVDAVARGRNQITFSGTAGQVAGAFRTSLHTYRDGAETHFAPSTDLSLPTAFADTVTELGNVSTFRPRPHVRLRAPESVGTRFTSSQTGNHFLTPKDVATIYDITPAYNAGYNGSGQTIAVVGQSSIRTTDITNFQNAAGLPIVAPTLVLVPNSGVPTLYTSDEGESDLDIEYTGGIAPGATILFVYAGSSVNYDVLDALNYAIDQRIAPVISVSYGLCEAALSSTSFASRNAKLAQAATQGQTVVAASGDSGSTDCYNVTSTPALPAATLQGLAVDFPASSPYVTGMGGTELSSANSVASNTTYWSTAAGSDVVSSALSYIPEQVWNDDSTSSGAISLSATGGGTSTLSARPSWQTGVPGIPAGNFRLLPDVSLLSSPVNVGYLYCSSDSATGVSGSCSNGFRDVNSSSVTVAGGTSFAAPIFAGMVALINQARNATGQGLINPTLYSLASNAATYASVFHDVATGTNACTAGVSGCSAAGSSSYAATAGYDEATGLGSVDLYKLLTAWPTGTVSTGAAASTVTLSPATANPAVSTADLVTIKVAANSGASTPVPTGTVSLVVDGSSTPTQITLGAGTASYSFSSAIAGTHTIVATYSGDANFAASNRTLVLTVGTPASTAAFSILAPNITVKAGSSATSTIRVTSSSGYTGTISWSLAARSGVGNFCYSISNVTLPAGSTQASTTLTVYTSSASCTTSTIKVLSAAASPGDGAAGPGRAATWLPARLLGATGFTLATLLGVGLLGRRSRRLRPLLGITVLLALGLGLSGCSSEATTATPTAFTATGSYTFNLTGTDTTASALNSSTPFTLTVN